MMLDIVNHYVNIIKISKSVKLSCGSKNKLLERKVYIREIIVPFMLSRKRECNPVAANWVPQRSLFSGRRPHRARQSVEEHGELRNVSELFIPQYLEPLLPWDFWLWEIICFLIL